MNSCKTIAICNRKGGVGKTTAAVDSEDCPAALRAAGVHDLGGAHADLLHGAAPVVDDHDAAT